VVISPCASLRAVLHRLSGGLHYASLVWMFPILQICPILSEQDVICEGLQGQGTHRALWIYVVHIVVKRTSYIFAVK
jgi:hypothetical protein